MRKLKLIVLLSLFALVPFVVAACGGDGDAPEPTWSVETSPEDMVAVEMGEWYFEVDKTAVPAGEVTFEASNAGAIEHELLVLRTDLPADQLPVEGAAVDTEAAGELMLGMHEEMHEEDGDRMSEGSAEPETQLVTLVDGGHGAPDRPEKKGKGNADRNDVAEDTHIGPGERDTYTVELEPGRYVLFCNLPGHYRSGQQVELEVTA